MSDIVAKQPVKTKNQVHSDIEIMMAKKFFIKLHECGVKRSPDLCHNLCDFLSIDKRYAKYLMPKKLQLCISDFKQSGYFRSIGTKKNKPEQEEYDSMELNKN